MMSPSPRHKRWPDALFRLPGQFGPQHLIFYWPIRPSRYMSGHQISYNGGPNDHKYQYIFFVWAPAPHLGSFRAVIWLCTARRQRGASRSRTCHASDQAQPAVFRSRRTSMRTSVASGHFSVASGHMCKQFGVLLNVRRSPLG